MKHCTFCLGTEHIETHHVDMDRTNNIEKNLILLCRRCHQLLHAKIYNRLIRAGMITTRTKNLVHVTRGVLRKAERNLTMITFGQVAVKRLLKNLQAQIKR